jgi:cell division protease FtsH
LEEKNVTLSALQEGASWLPYLLLMGLPWILLIGFFIYTARQMRGQMKSMGGVFSVGKSRAKRYAKSSSEVSFEDAAGMENAKKDLAEIIEYLKNPQRFTSLGADIPKGILLMGPPGCGKTLLARAAAGEADVPFFSISGSEFIEMLVGVGASRVRDMFGNAKREAPSIIFIDEIDSVGRVRGTGIGGGHDEREQTLNQILSEMDGFEPHESVVVLAATNRPDVLDPALTRPGRFDRQIVVELPHKEARLAILKIHTRGVPLSEDVDLANMAGRTVGFSGADLKNLVNEAALLGGRKNSKRVDAEDFEEARDKIQLGAVREDKIEEDEKRTIAYHESGHTLVAKLLPNTDPLQKVTIIPRGRSLGATEQVPETDRHNLSRPYLLDRIAVLLGGRASERIVFDELTTGSGNDLKAATQLARKMVCQWGMSEKLGPVTYPLGEDHPFLGREMTQSQNFSENTAKLIDAEILEIIADMEQKALDLLESHRSKLDALAGALLERESLENDEIDDILKLETTEARNESARLVHTPEQ